MPRSDDSMDRWLKALTMFQAFRSVASGGPESSIATHGWQKERG